MPESEETYDLTDTEETSCTGHGTRYAGASGTRTEMWTGRLNWIPQPPLTIGTFHCGRKYHMPPVSVHTRKTIIL